MFPNQSEHVFVVLEGIDGVGKTTIGRILAAQINGIYYHTPPISITRFSFQEEAISINLRHFVDKTASNHERFFFYLWSLHRASSEIVELLQHSHVVCDRYWASTLAYHKAMQSDIPFIDFSKLAILAPDFHFLLNVSDSVQRIRRLRERSTCSRSDEEIEADTVLQEKILDEYQSLGLETIDVMRPINVVVFEVLCLIEKQTRFRQNPTPQFLDIRSRLYDEYQF